MLSPDKPSHRVVLDTCITSGESMMGYIIASNTVWTGDAEPASEIVDELAERHLLGRVSSLESFGVDPLSIKVQKRRIVKIGGFVLPLTRFVTTQRRSR